MQVPLRKTLLLGLTLAALAGCGGRQELRLPAGETMPVAPAGVAKAPTSEELLEAPTTARPGRVTEILRRSEERRDDRFDLPPPG